MDVHQFMLAEALAELQRINAHLKALLNPGN